MEAEGENRLRWSRNAQLLHFGLEGCALHAKLGRSPCRTTDGPFRLAKGFEDVFTFGLFKRRRPGIHDVTGRPL